MANDNAPKKRMYLINNNTRADTPICRYMSFDKFIQLVEGKLYVPRKKSFWDIRESGKIPPKFRWAFSLHQASNFEGQKSSEKIQKDIDQEIKNVLISRLLLTSCWTIDNGEDYLMWKAYAGDCGICVHTTIEKLLEAINYDKENYLVVCSPMFYGHYKPRKPFLETIFKKDLPYQSENEIRFYFLKDKDIMVEEQKEIETSIVERMLLEACEDEEKMFDDNKKNYASHIIFDINPMFIDSITLSPTIPSLSVQCFRKMLTRQYKNIFTNEKSIKQSTLTY